MPLCRCDQSSVTLKIALRQKVTAITGICTMQQRCNEAPAEALPAESFLGQESEQMRQSAKVFPQMPATMLHPQLNRWIYTEQTLRLDGA